MYEVLAFSRRRLSQQDLEGSVHLTQLTFMDFAFCFIFGDTFASIFQFRKEKLLGEFIVSPWIDELGY